MKIPKAGTLQDDICTKVYSEVEVQRSDLQEQLSKGRRYNSIVIALDGLIRTGILFIKDNDTVYMSTDLRKYYDDIKFERKVQGQVVPPSTLNRMDLATYKPPKYEERRAGSMEYKSWPSTGGD